MCFTFIALSVTSQVQQQQWRSGGGDKIQQTALLEPPAWLCPPLKQHLLFVTITLALISLR